VKKTALLSATTFLFLVTGLSVTQETQTAPISRDGGVQQRLISILIPSTPNAPFTAIVHTEWTRILGDGSTITLKNHRAIGRDSAGRIFQERRMLAPDGDTRETTLTEIEISNPVSRDLYICVLQRLTCRLLMFRHPGGASSTAAAAKIPGMEDLGARSIEGLEALGRQQTRTVPANAFGNDRPLVSKKEYWYSPALGINLISKTEDPRFGTQSFEVSDIVRGEPDPKLFQLPAGLKIIDLRHSPVVPSGATQP